MVQPETNAFYECLHLLSIGDQALAENDLLLFGNAFIHLVANTKTGEKSAIRVEPEKVYLLKDPKNPKDWEGVRRWDHEF